MERSGSDALFAGAIPQLHCNGTALRNELEGRPVADLGELTALCARVIAQRFGEGPIEGRIRALVVSVART
jgi:hypothetical protein